MARIQSPPGHFNDLALLIEELDPRSLLRFAWKDATTHCQFRTEARFRFDAPDGSFGVLYATFDIETAFAETVLRDRAIHTPAIEIPLDFRAIEARVVVEFRSGEAQRPLRLVKLYDEGLAAARTDNEISVRDHYPTTRRWALAFHNHPLAPDGILYMSRYMGARKSVALFDRCRDAIEVHATVPLLQHPAFPSLIRRFRLAIDPP